MTPDASPDFDTSYPHGHVDVVLVDELSQVHLGMGLGHADHGLDVAHRDGHRSRGHGLLAQIRVHLGHLVLVHVVQLGLDLFPGVEDVLLKQVLGDLLYTAQIGCRSQLLLHLVHLCHVLLLGHGVVPPVRTNDEASEVLVHDGIHGVADHAEDVEP